MTRRPTLAQRAKRAVCLYALRRWIAIGETTRGEWEGTAISWRMVLPPP